MTWTDDRVDTLKKLWNDGESASAIAQKIGAVTRNAVIGKVHRLGLAGRATFSRKRGSPRPRPPFPAKSNGLRRPISRPAYRNLRPRGGKAQKRSPILPELESPPEEPITVQTLTALTCHWPIGDPKMAGFHFCGRGKPDSGPYCDHHAAIAFR